MCQVGYLPELYEDARSENYIKKNKKRRRETTLAAVILCVIWLVFKMSRTTHVN